MSISMVIMGFFVGIMVGLTGVGGAALLTPVLILIGINPSVAVGTDLAYNSITKFFGSLQHWKQKTIDIKLVKFLAMGSIPAAVTAVIILHVFNAFFQNQEDIIKFSLGCMLIVVASVTLLKTFFMNKFSSKKLKEKSKEEKQIMTVVIGATLGFLVGLTSIGSGSLFALAMLVLYKLRTPVLVGTDIAHAFILVTVAGLMHSQFGNVDYLLMFNLLFGSVPGVLLGSSLSSKFPARPLRAIMAFLILISGITML